WQEGHKVVLNVYDLSNGLARQLSTSFLGKPIEAIWHTGVVVYGNEYFFGGGIQAAPAGATQYGRPVRVVDLGVTHLPREVFEDYLRDIAPRYTAATYSLLTHNCNNFSNEVAQFLVGAGIPDYILNLPNEVMSSPMGAMIMPMIQNLEATLRNNAAPQTTQFVPTPASVSVPQPVASADKTPSSTAAAAASAAPVGSSSKKEEEKKIEKQTPEKAAAAAPAMADPLGSMRGKVQEEVMREFAALMASGTLRASEAAALAMRRVMERHGDGASMQVK
uniref:PPPDE domain-containing protein n=1 Tax=Aegilops tauschii subsp. strangulata TaxID=200361 RepID=A0A453Q172_AEGTS